MLQRNCAECHASMSWQPRRKYCPDCALTVKRRQALAHYYAGRRKQGAPLSGDTVDAACQYCSRKFSHVLRKRLRTVCDECNRRLSGQARARWAKEHPERVAEIKKRSREKNPPDQSSGRFRKYGVTREWHDKQLARQDGKCANKACGRSEPGGRHGAWHIDHDHATGVVRGLLCNGCNIAIGFTRDDVDVLTGLAAYLKQHRQLRLAV